MAYQAIPVSQSASSSPFQTRMNVLSGSLATFTAKRWAVLGIYPAGVSIASRTNNQTAISGAGVGNSGSPTTLALSNNLVQTPKTLPWFVAFRGKVTGAFAGVQYGLLGVHDGTNDFARIGYAGGYSNSFWAMDVGHGGATTSGNSTIALDTSTHDFALFYDGSTAAKFYLDGVVAVTISTLTNFPTTAQSMMIMGSTNVVNITEMFYAFNETT